LFQEVQVVIGDAFGVEAVAELDIRAVRRALREYGKARHTRYGLKKTPPLHRHTIGEDVRIVNRSCIISRRVYFV
jgi:hypothetical protein